MQWIAHAGLQEGGARPNSRESIVGAARTDFRVEFDVIFRKGEFWLAHSEAELLPDALPLQEALELLPNNSISLDLKSSGEEGRLGEILQRFPLEERLLLCGHDEDSLLRVPGSYQRGLSVSHHNPRPIKEILDRTRADGIMLEYKRIADLPAIRSAGLWVHLWTIDDPVFLYRIRKEQVDGITSNHPRWMRYLWDSRIVPL
jgi:hypothetical protein